MTEYKQGCVKNMAAAPSLGGGGLLHQHAVNPGGVVRDDGVNARLLQLATLLPSVGSDADDGAVVEQRTSGVALSVKEATGRDHC